MDTRRFFRIMPGGGSMHAKECFADGFIGGDWGFKQDLTNELTDHWRDFNKKFIPVFLTANPEKSKVAAGLACGMLHKIAKGMRIGDIVLSPIGDGFYRVGEVTSDYCYQPNAILPHRRAMRWYEHPIERDAMSQELKNSAGSIGAVSELTKYADELKQLIVGDTSVQPLVSTDGSVIDPTAFALEKHLEDFLVKNWGQTEIGKDYDLFEVEGELAGQQYPTDTGPIDILAIRKDRKQLLVIELKKGRASDSVVGQIQRYMGYVIEELAEEGQTVKGVIIALEDDLKIRRALKVATSIDFYRYQIDFKLFKSHV